MWLSSADSGRGAGITVVPWTERLISKKHYIQVYLKRLQRDACIKNVTVLGMEPIGIVAQPQHSKKQNKYFETTLCNMQ